MNIKKFVNPLLLLLTAFIWGVAFVAQKSGAGDVGPFGLTAARSFLGGIALIPVILILGKKAPQPVIGTGKPKTLIIGGIICGTALFSATAFQQYGITVGADAGKAGFITALYIIMVPIISIFLGNKPTLKIWISVVLSIIGLYLLCVSGTGGISKGDILLFICALLFSFHILVVDRIAPRVECVKMSAIQFFVCGIWALLFMLITGEHNTIADYSNAMVSILYLGFMSSGVGYTLQIVGQRGTDPTVASIILSLESVFSVIAGLAFGETLTLREGIGCFIMFFAIILSQLPSRKKCE